MKNYFNQFIFFIFSLLMLGCKGLPAKTFVEKHVGDDTIQGLKYINDQAIEFINTYNQTHHTNWQSLEPDPKTIVYKCSVPMQAKWITAVSDVIGIDHDVYYIAVSCNKTVSNIEEAKQWVIEVPTTRPKQSSN